MKKGLVLLMVIASAGIIFFTILRIQGTKKGVYDMVDKQNNKVGILFNQLIEKEKERIRGKNWYAGIMPNAVTRMDAYLKSLQQIESYASKGTESKDKFNKLEVRITFADGKIVNALYTGNRVVQAYGMGAQLLIKMQLENGKVTTTYTNGVELNATPSDIQNDLIAIQDAVLRYDRSMHPNDYYYPQKTSAEKQKEWDAVK
jgi:hypothetical protein